MKNNIFSIIFYEKDDFIIEAQITKNKVNVSRFRSRNEQCDGLYIYIYIVQAMSNHEKASVIQSYRYIYKYFLFQFIYFNLNYYQV